jgi:hypothetical protein
MAKRRPASMRTREELACRLMIVRAADSTAHQQRTTLMEASPPRSEGTLYVCVLQLGRGGFTDCSSGATVDGS